MEVVSLQLEDRVLSCFAAIDEAFFILSDAVTCDFAIVMRLLLGSLEETVELLTFLIVGFDSYLFLCSIDLLS
jgi:hypothetical protein